jgi:exodeoxyribonuclease-5
MKLTQEQKVVASGVMSLLKKGQKIIRISGHAGVGKSFLISKIIKLLPHFSVCSFTGKAASVLRQKGVHASTIHSLIYRPMVNAAGDMVRDHYGNPIFARIEKLDADGIICDEASMISKDLLDDLTSFSLPIIFVGDGFQLEPIGKEINLMQNADFELKTLHRNAGEIAFFCEFIRNGYRPAAFRPSFEGKVRFLSRWQADAYLTQVDQIICAFNRTRVQLNRKVREKLGRIGDSPVVGDRVMCLRNNRNVGLFNGMQGEVKFLYTKKNRMHFRNDEGSLFDVVFDPNNFNAEHYELEMRRGDPDPFDFCNAITAHKCVHPDTLVETEDGLLPIKSIKPQGVISTPFGVQKYDNCVSNPERKSVEILTKDGYSITTTIDHKVEVWDDGFVLKEAKDINVGDIMRVYLGSMIKQSPLSLPMLPNGDIRAKLVKRPQFLDEGFAEFLGLMVADGTVFHSGFRVAKRHNDVLEKFEKHCVFYLGANPKRIHILGTPAIEVSSRILSDWLLGIDGLAPNKKSIPEIILRSNVNIQAAFLRGLFEDGTVNLKDGFADHIEWSSSYPQMVQQVRVMLLRLGIISGTLCGKNDRIYIYGNQMSKFKKLIGFMSSFKNDRIFDKTEESSKYVVPFSKCEIKSLKSYFDSVFDYRNGLNRKHISRRVLQKIINEHKELDFISERMQYHYTQVIKLTNVLSPSMCVEVADGHRFMQNGFPHGNSQGSEWDSVMVFEQRGGQWDKNRWNYTSASRAKEKLLWVAM